MDMPETPALNPLQQSFAQLRDDLQRCIIGQPHLIDCLLVTLLADGHLLVEGAPGLAKTTAVKALAARIEADFHRVQFTPDLLPADLTGTDVFRPQTGSFEFERGPLFHNIVLADEINRAPAKVQSALLEAMAERQITVGRATRPLPELFMVMATQKQLDTSALPQGSSGTALAILVPGAAALFGLAFRMRKSGLARLGMIALVALAVSFGMTACNARYYYFNHGPLPGKPTPAGTYQMKVTAQASDGITATTHSADFVLTVNAVK